MCVCVQCVQKTRNVQKMIQKLSYTYHHLMIRYHCSRKMEWSCHCSRTQVGDKKEKITKDEMCWYVYHWSWLTQDLYMCTVQAVWNSLHLHFMKQICFLEFDSRKCELAPVLARNSILHILKYIYFITEKREEKGKKRIVSECERGKDGGKMKM